MNKYFSKQNASRMEEIASYFTSLEFYLVEQKQINGMSYSLYAAKISSLLGDGQRYILLFVPSSLSDVSKSHISMLRWDSLQTRILQKNYDIPTQTFSLKEQKEDHLHVVSRNDNCTYYSCPTIYAEFGLLHDPKKKSKLQFPDNLSLARAFATYSCVVRL